MLFVRRILFLFICASGSAVEHLLAKEGVAGSIPVSRFFNNRLKIRRLFFLCVFNLQLFSPKETHRVFGVDPE